MEWNIESECALPLDPENRPFVLRVTSRDSPVSLSPLPDLAFVHPRFGIDSDKVRGASDDSNWNGTSAECSANRLLIYN